MVRSPQYFTRLFDRWKTAFAIGVARVYDSYVVRPPCEREYLLCRVNDVVCDCRVVFGLENLLILRDLKRIGR